MTTSSIPSDGSSTLPFTGMDRGKLVAIGVSALILGLLLVLGAAERQGT